jgi:hypothetical protein
VCDETDLKAQDSIQKMKSLFTRASRPSKKSSVAEDEDEDDAMDEEEEMRMMQRMRRGNRGGGGGEEAREETNHEENESEKEEIADKVADLLILTRQAEESEEDFLQSSKFYFSKYYMLILERLQNFLEEETNKLLSTGPSINISFLSSSPFSNSFNNLVKAFRAHIFLANNLEHLIQVAEGMNLLSSFKKIDAGFESSFRAVIDSSLDKACELFAYLSAKWTKWVNLNLASGQKSHSLDDDVALDEDHVTSETSTSRKSPRFRLPSIVSKRNSADSFDKVSLKSVKASATSVFKFPFVDSKRKRKEEFTLMLKETIVVCMRVLVEKEGLARVLRIRVLDHVGPMLHYFESTGELRQWIESYSIRTEDQVSLSEKVVGAFFEGVLV